MAVNTKVSGDVVTIKVEGRFDFATHQDFQRAYKTHPKGEKQYVVDLSETDYMDSSAMGMLLQLREHADNAKRIALNNGNEGIKEILRIANFDKLFELA